MVAERIDVTGEALVVHRFGIPGSRPKVYLQGALHADEVSATVALVELVGLLQVADAAGEICGEVIVLPHCNPLGAKQFILGRHAGRFSLDGRNFNRAFPQIGERVVEQLKLLGPDRQTTAEALRIGTQIFDSLTRVGAPVERLQAALMRLAWGSDVIVDIHADMEAILHLYTSEKSWPVFQPLTRGLDIPIVILSDKPADSPFDEVHDETWTIINLLLGESVDHPKIQTAVCTLELRGLSDVSAELASSDSQALLDFLIHSGAITGTSETNDDAAPLLTTLDAVDVVRSPTTGVVIHLKPLGAKVSAGDNVARLYDPSKPDPEASWQDVIAHKDGIVFARWHQRMIQAGMAVVKIASLSRWGSYEPGRLLD